MAIVTETIATQLDLNGVLHEVHGRWLLGSSGEPITWISICEPTRGHLVVEQQREGWLCEERVAIAATFLVLGSPAPAAAHLPGMIFHHPRLGPLRTDDYAWTCISLTGSGKWTESAESRPTEDGAVSVRYTWNPDRKDAEAIHVRAFCSEAQNEAIVELLQRYVIERRSGRRGVLFGVDPVCLHDPALWDGVHTEACSLVALDRMVEALVVEVEALLAETDAWRGGSDGVPHT